MSIPGSANPLLLRSATPAGYSISRSLRFNSSDSAYLSRTPASAGNRKTWTWAGWVKFANVPSGQYALFNASTGSGNANTGIDLDSSSSQLRFVIWNGSGVDALLTTTQSFRDFSAWYHFVVAVDTTQATSSNRVKLYVNGVQVANFSSSTYPSQNYDTAVNLAQAHNIGRNAGTAAAYFSGYLADIYFIDGQALTPSSFTETDANTGQLIPKAYTGTYGTNGFHLEFADNSSNTATTLGKDTSGNGNNWTPNNLSVTAGAGNDSLVDVPTSSGTDSGLGGEVRGNYATFNPLITSAATLTNGNLDASISNTTRAWSTIALPSGKWYAEITLTAVPELVHCGVIDGSAGTYVATYISNGQKTIENSSSAYGASYAANDVIGIAIDVDSKSAQFFKNGSSQGTFNWTNTYSPYYLAFESRGGVAGTRTATANFGQRPFAYTAPSGFKALCTANLPAPVVTKPSTVFDVALYTGTGVARSITGLGFSPDWVWIKARNFANDHKIFDAVRGATKVLESSNTSAESTDSGSLTAFDSAGFSLGTAASTNKLNDTYAAWCWDAGSSTVTNTAGSITSTVRANATAGFSIVSWTNGSLPYTVGHGLGVAPSFIVLKSRTSGTQSWQVGHVSIGWTKRLYLNLTAAAETSSSAWNDTAPTSTVFTVGNTSLMTGDMIAYCFAPVVGYSSFGSYIGTGGANPFVYLGFRPRWVMVKRSSTSGDNWWIIDSARNTYNLANSLLYPSDSAAETSSPTVDFLSNGFVIRTGNSGYADTNGSTYIYAAFAESPFNYARAR